MAHANKTYVSNGGTIGVTSLLPGGDANPPANGIEVLGTVAHGNIITVMSGSDIDFGNIAPDVLIYMNMDALTADTNLALTRGVTFGDGYICKTQRLSYTSANQMPVHSVAAMPWGVAFPYGDLAAYPSGSILNPKMETRVSRPYSSFYRFSYMQWPAANQANLLANLGTGEQVKAYGDQFEDGFSRGDQTKADVYQGIYIQVAGVMQSSQALGVSNSGSFGGSQTSSLGAHVSGGLWYYPTVTNNASAVVSSGIVYPANTNMNVYLDATHLRSSLLCYETFIVSGETNIRADTRVIDTTLGVISDIHDTALANPNCTNKKFDRFDMPKNVQGYNVPNNKHFYTNGVIQLVSEIEGVASCRCMIANTPTPVKDTTQLSMCIPLMWSAHLLRILVIGGMFEDNSLSGKYLHFYGTYNTFLGSYLIP
jgi:hypothetical protein